MSVEPKFSNNTEVWIIYNNKACKLPIIGTSAFINKDDTVNISYIINTGMIGECFNEDHCFATKEELINSL